MTLTLNWVMSCDMCDYYRANNDGQKYVTPSGRFEYDRLFAEYGFIERPDGLLQCERHPRLVSP